MREDVLVHEQVCGSPHVFYFLEPEVWRIEKEGLCYIVSEGVGFRSGATGRAQKGSHYMLWKGWMSDE
jgi:hypothetical protein